jgi:hypothetical protein
MRSYQERFEPALAANPGSLNSGMAAADNHNINFHRGNRKRDVSRETKLVDKISYFPAYVISFAYFQRVFHPKFLRYLSPQRRRGRKEKILYCF